MIYHRGKIIGALNQRHTTASFAAPPPSFRPQLPTRACNVTCNVPQANLHQS
jgi:hypothetical protein